MDYSAIQADTHFLLNTDATSYPIASLTANVNRHEEEVISKILQYDTNWLWDDSNFSTLPIGTTTLVNGQADYGIAASTFLKILRVEILDSNGTYQLIKPFDEQDVTQSLTQYAGTNGLPTTYRKLGDSIILYPTPATGSVTLAAGLKVYYQRPHDPFLTSDTTKTPGFSPLYHRLLSLGSSLDYAMSNNMSQKINMLVPLIAKMENELCIFYTRRPAEQRPRLTTRYENTR